MRSVDIPVEGPSESFPINDEALCEGLDFPEGGLEVFGDLGG